MSDGKVEVEPVSNYPYIPAEIPGVRIEAHTQPETGAIEAPQQPTMSYLAAAARANAGLAPTTGVSQPTRVVSIGVVDLTETIDDEPETITVPKQ